MDRKLLSDLESAILMHGNSHPAVAQIYHSLGEFFLGKDFASAQKYFNMALKIREEKFGLENEDTLDSRYRLGIVMAACDEVGAEEIRSFNIETLAMRQKFDSLESDLLSRALDSSTGQDSTLIYNDVAEDYRSNFEYDTSNKLYTKCIEIRRRKYGDKSIHLSVVISNYAECLRLQGRYDEAESLLREVLAIAIQTYGALSEHVGEVMNNLGLILVAKGNFGDAESLLREGLRLRKFKFGDFNIFVGSSLSNIAELYREKGDFVAALSYHRSAIDAFEQSVGVDHPGSVNARGNLGITLHRQARVGFENGDALVKKAVSFMNEKGYDPRHPWIMKFNIEHSLNEALKLTQSGKYHLALKSYEKLTQEFELNKTVSIAQRKELAQDRSDALLFKARELRQKGHYADVEQICEDCLRSLSEFQARSDAFFLKVLCMQAENRMSIGSYQVAKELLLEILQIRTDVLGPDHVDVGEVMVLLAEWYRSMALYSEAETLSVQALEVLAVNIKRDQDPSMALLHLNARAFLGLVDLYAQKNAFETVLLLMDQAKTLCDSRDNEIHPLGPELMELQSYVLLAQGDIEGSQMLNSKVIDIRTVLHGPSHPSLATVMTRNSELLLVKGRYPEAMAQAKQSIDMLLKFLPPKHPSIGAAKLALAKAQLAQSELKLATFSIVDSLAIAKATFGPKHPATARALMVLADVNRCKGSYAEIQVHNEEAKAIVTETHTVSGVDEITHLDLYEAYKGMALTSEVCCQDALALQWFDGCLRILSSLSVKFGGVSETFREAEIFLGKSQILCRMLQINEARENLGKAAKIFQSFLTNSNPRIADLLMSAAAIAKVCGLHRHARVLYSKCLAVRLLCFEKHHVSVLQCIVEAADNMRIPGYYHDALQLCEVAQGLLKDAESAKQATGLSIQMLKCKILSDQGDLEACDPLLLETYRLIRGSTGETSRLNLSALTVRIQNALLKSNASIADINVKQAIALTDNGNGETYSMELLALKVQLLKLRLMIPAALQLINDIIIPTCKATIGENHPFYRRCLGQIGLIMVAVDPPEENIERNRIISEALNFLDTYPHFHFTADHPWVRMFGGYSLPRSTARTSSARFEPVFESWAVPRTLDDRSFGQLPLDVKICMDTEPLANWGTVTASIAEQEDAADETPRALGSRVNYLYALDPAYIAAMKKEKEGSLPEVVLSPEQTDPTLVYEVEFDFGSLGLVLPTGETKIREFVSRDQIFTVHGEILSADMGNPSSEQTTQQTDEQSTEQQEQHRPAGPFQLINPVYDDLEVGDIVEARYGTGLEWFPAQIEVVHRNSYASNAEAALSYNIVYTDGEKETEVNRRKLRREGENEKYYTIHSVLEEIFDSPGGDGEASPEDGEGGEGEDATAVAPVGDDAAGGDHVEESKRYVRIFLTNDSKIPFGILPPSLRVDACCFVAAQSNTLPADANCIPATIMGRAPEGQKSTFALAEEEEEKRILAELDAQRSEEQKKEIAEQEERDRLVKEEREKREAEERAKVEAIERERLAKLRKEQAEDEAWRAAEQAAKAAAAKERKEKEEKEKQLQEKVNAAQDGDPSNAEGVKITSLEAAKYMLQRASDLSQLGLFSQAQPFFEEGVRIRDKYFAGNQLSVDARVGLSKNFIDLYRWDEASEVLAACLTAQVLLAGMTSPMGAQIHFLNALNYISQGYFRPAEDKFKVVERNLWELNDDSSILLSEYLNARACNFLILNNLEEAKALMDKAEKVNQKSKAERGGQIADMLMIQGELLRYEANFVEAKVLFEQAVMKRMHQFGDNHISVGVCALRLARNNIDQGLYDEADARLRSAHLIRSEYMPDDHPLICEIFHFQGVIQQKMGRFTKAKSLHNLALTGRTKTLGDMHVVTSDSHQALGELAATQGDYDTARAYFKKAYQSRRACMGDSSALLAETIFWQAEVERKTGNLSDAKPLYDKSLEIRTAIFGREHPIFAQSEMGLAELNADIGYYDKAERLFMRVMKLRGAVYGTEHAEYADCLNAYGDCLRRSKNFSLAIEKLKVAVELRKYALGEDHLLVAESVNNLTLARLTKAYAQKMEEVAKVPPPPPDDEGEEVELLGPDPDRIVAGVSYEAPASASTPSDAVVSTLTADAEAGALEIVQVEEQATSPKGSVSHTSEEVRNTNLQSKSGDGQEGEHQQGDVVCESPNGEEGEEGEGGEVEEELEGGEDFLRDKNGLPIFPTKLFEDSLEQFENCLRIFKIAFAQNPDHPNVVNVIGNLAVLRFIEYQMKEMFIVSLPKEDRKALRKREAEASKLDEEIEFVEPGSVEIDATLDKLTKIHQFTKRHPWINKFSAFRVEREKPPDDLEIAKIAFKKAEDFRGKNLFYQADMLYDEALSSQVESLGAVQSSTNMEVLATIIGKSDNSLAQNRLEIAKRVYVQGLAISYKIGRKARHFSIQAKFGLAEILRLIRDWENAKILHLEVLGLRIQYYGEGSNAAAQSYLCLAEISLENAAFDEALKYVTDALAIREGVLSVDADGVAGCHCITSKVFLCKGMYAQALEKADYAYQIVRKVHGDEHYRAADVLQLRAEIKYEMGKYFDARKEITKALKIRIQHFGRLQKYMNSSPSGIQTAQFLEVVDLLIDNDAEVTRIQSLHLSRFTSLQLSEEQEKKEQAQAQEDDESYQRTKFMAKVGGGPAVTEVEAPPTLFEYQGTPLANNAFIAESLYLRGRISMAIGEFQEATELLQGALHMRTCLYGHRSLITVESKYQHAVLNQRKGAIAQSLITHKEIYEYRLKLIGESHQQTIDSAYAMATVSFELTRFDEALKYFNESLQSRRRVHGSRHNKTLEATLGTAQVLTQMGKYGEAEAILAGLMETVRLVHGETHPLIGSIFHAQAELSSILGYYDTAFAEIEQAISLRGSLIGDEHPDTVLCSLLLGNVMRQKAKFMDSQKTLEDCFSVHMKRLDPNHPHCIVSVLYLGLNLMNTAKFSQARAFLEKAVSLSMKVYGKFHALTADTTAALGENFMRESFYKASREMYSEARTIRLRVFGEEHASVAACTHALSQLTMIEGEVDWSIKGFEESLALRRRCLGQMHREVAMSLQGLGAAFLKQGQVNEAKAMFDRALTMRQSVLPSYHPDIGETQLCLAAVCKYQGKIEQGYALCSRALVDLRDAYGPCHNIVAQALYATAEFANIRGDYMNAKTWYKDALQMRHNLYKDVNIHHPEIAESVFGIGEGMRSLGVYTLHHPWAAAAVIPVDPNSNTDKGLLAEALRRGDDRYDADDGSSDYVPESVKFGEDGKSLVSDLTTGGQYQISAPLDDSSDCSALTMYERSLWQLRRLFTEDHIFVLCVEFSWAETLRLIGRYDEAHAKYEHVLFRRRRTLGDSHIDTVEALWGLGEILRAKALLYPESRRVPGYGQPDSAFAYYSKPEGNQVTLADHVSSVLGIKAPTTGEGFDPASTCRIAIEVAAKEVPRAILTSSSMPNLGGGTHPHPARKNKLKLSTGGFMGYSFPDTKKLQRVNWHGVARPAKLHTSDAKWLYEHGVSLLKAIFGVDLYDHPLWANIMFSKGELLRARCDAEHAVPALEQAVVMRKRLFRTDHPGIADCLNGLAEILRSDNKYIEAAAVYGRVLEIRTQAFDGLHPSIADVENNIAIMYYNQGRYEDAFTLFSSAKKMRESLLGLKHPAVAQSLNNLAGVLHILGRGKEAEPMYRKAIDIKRASFGEFHPDVGSAMNNMGLLLKSLGRWDEAMSMYLEALDIQRSTLGMNHIDVATTMHNLAGLYTVQGRRIEARDTYRACIDIKKRVLGPKHSSLASSQNNFASLLHAMDELEDAKDLYEESLKIRRTVYGEMHPTVAESLNNIGLVLFTQNQVDDAKSLLERAIDIKRVVHGPDHPVVGSSMQNLAMMLQQFGRREQAIAYYAEAERIRQAAQVAASSGGGLGGPRSSGSSSGSRLLTRDGRIASPVRGVVEEDDMSFIKDGHGIEDDGGSFDSALQFG